MRCKDTLIEYCTRCGQPVHRLVFPSQAEHSRWHIENDPRYKRRKGGGEHDL